MPGDFRGHRAPRKDKKPAQQRERYLYGKGVSPVPLRAEAISTNVYCGPRRKFMYATRSAAKRAVKLADDPSQEYRCPTCDLWHLTTHDKFGRKLT